jgi:hypothetical protein
LPSQPLIKYALTTPGVHLVIIGIGNISNKDAECQLTSNLAASQVLPDGLTEEERTAVEEMTGKVKEGKTNYFQTAAIPLTAPATVSVLQEKADAARNAKISWNTAYAGDAPIKNYQIWRDGAKIKDIPFSPQLATIPFTFSEILNDKTEHTYVMKVEDARGRIAESMPVILEKIV